ncbi:MAG TPA: GxxExxY protein [Opitutus sp.]|nr:GxxExxY protein [Opitutus sp.]
MGRVVVPEQIEKIASDAIDAALAVHRALGPGLLESAYRECLNLELTARGHRIESEQLLPITYRGHVVSNAYRTDLLVDRQLLIELKAIEAIQPVHRVQLTTYLRLSRLPLGLLINFNVPLLKEGLHRVLNLDSQTPLRESSPSSRLRA